MRPNKIGKSKQVNTEAINLVSKSQCVPVEHLLPVSCSQTGNDIPPASTRDLKPRQCFSNAYNLSVTVGCDAVVGYVFLAEFGIVIEHAWNVDERGHFDLTAQLFWDSEVSGDQYFQLLRLTPDDAIDCVAMAGGIDTLSLRHSDKHKHLFRPTREHA